MSPVKNIRESEGAFVEIDRFRNKRCLHQAGLKRLYCAPTHADIRPNPMKSAARNGVGASTRTVVLHEPTSEVGTEVCHKKNSLDNVCGPRGNVPTRHQPRGPPHYFRDTGDHYRGENPPSSRLSCLEDVQN